jgi:hypothetical protein
MGMAKKIFWTFTGFAFGTIFGGIGANILVTYTFSTMNSLLLCPVDNLQRTSVHLLYVTIIFSIRIYMLGYIVNAAWWHNAIEKKIQVSFPFYPENDDTLASIQITNNSNYAINDLVIEP